MKNRQPFLRYGFAAVLLGSGIATTLFYNSDENQTDTPATPQAPLLSASTNPSLPIDTTPTTLPASAPLARYAINQKNLKQSWLPSLTKDTECAILVNTTFKSSYLRHALDIGSRQTDSAQQMDYVRWALSSYANKDGALSPDNLEQVEKESGIPATRIIQIIQGVTRQYYEQHRAPSTNTNYGMLSYWRDLALAYPLAGTDSNGQYNAALAEATTSYDLATIKNNRDQYLYGAAMEILNDTVKQMGEILLNNSLSDLRERITSMPQNNLMSLHERVSVLEYIIRGPSGNTLPIPDHIREELYHFNITLEEELVRRMSVSAEKADADRKKELGCKAPVPQ